MALLLPRLAARAAVLLLSSGLGLASHAADLTVSAAASLTQAFRELGPVFEAAHPGTRVVFNFAASGALLQQIARGAPADVYASADQVSMDQAQQRRLIQPASRRDFVSNALVVVVPAGSTQVPVALADLTRPAYARIAIGLPASVPVGRYTQEALRSAGLWAAIEPKLISANHVRQALDYVARAEVDAGFVYATDAALLPDKVKLAFTVPTGRPILYPVATVASSTQAVLAQKFVDFLVAAPAQAVLARHGFGKP